MDSEEYDVLLFSNDNLEEDDGDSTPEICDVILLDTSDADGENNSSVGEDTGRVVDSDQEQSNDDDVDLNSDTEIEHSKNRNVVVKAVIYLVLLKEGIMTLESAVYPTTYQEPWEKSTVLLQNLVFSQ